MLITIAVPSQKNSDTHERKNEELFLKPHQTASDPPKPSKAAQGLSSKDYKSNAVNLLTEVARLTVAIDITKRQPKTIAYDSKTDLGNHEVLRSHLERVILSPTTNDERAIGGEAGGYESESGKELNKVQARLIEANLRRRSRFLGAHHRANALAYTDHAVESEDPRSTFKRLKVPDVDAIAMTEAVFPPSSKGLKEQQVFRCPCCCKTLPNTIKDEPAWK
jgi:hypothetical protein